MSSATVDVVLDKLCRSHIILFVFAFTRGLPGTWNIMMPVFVAPSNILFHCTGNVEMGANKTSGRENNPCANTTAVVDHNDTALCYRLNGDQDEAGEPGEGFKPCTSWIYDRSLYGKTVNEEWNMVCGNRWMVSFVQSIFIAGSVVGGFASSHTSDWTDQAPTSTHNDSANQIHPPHQAQTGRSEGTRHHPTFGRKKTIMGGLLLSIAASFMSAFSTTPTMYYVARFLMAIGVSAYMDITYTFTMETVSPRYRFLSATMMGGGWTTGLVLVPWVAYLAKDLRLTHLYAAVPLAPLLVLCCFLPESPRWLMATGRFAAAKKVVAHFAKQASMPPHLVDEIIDEAKRNKAASRDVKRATIADLFSTKFWMKITTLFSIQLVVNMLMWYRMTVSAANVGGNPYLNFTIAVLPEYLVRLVNALIIKYCRRRPIISGTMLVQALVMVALCLLPLEYRWVRLGLLIAGKVGSSVNGAVVDVHITETYPTVARSVALGFCFTLGYVGYMVAPFLEDLGHATQLWVPNVVAAGLCLTGASSALLFPEGFQKTLEDGFAKQDGTVENVATGSPERQQVYVVQASQLYAFPEDGSSVLERTPQSEHA